MLAALLSSTAIALNLSAPIGAPENNEVDLITVVGARAPADIAGAIHFIPEATLEIFNHADINRVLRAVPGVNIQEEDGYGLRPNIGLRGSGTDRSSKIVIMEDGVLMAPAPYAAPAAYYFPTTGRMSAVEITKGPGTIKYGPNTTAGALQFFSTPIPDEAKGHATIMVTDLDRASVHAWAGNRFSPNTLPFDIGFLVETYQDKGDGFKQLETGDSGFDIADYVIKAGLYSRAGAQEQSLEFKYQHSDQTSDETYLGLTQADYDRSPNMRYNASQLDQFVGDHTTYQATHRLAITDNVTINTIAYRTDFARNWRKLDKFDNSNLSGLAACRAIDAILRDPSTCSQEFKVLTGPEGFVSPDDVLGLRHNNRSYYAAGIQTAIGFTFSTGQTAHNLTTSVRYHQDEVDRFQQQDQYRIDNSQLVRTTDNDPGTQANRLSSATAWSGYIEDRMVRGPVEVTAGVRIESVETEQTRWSTPARTTATQTRFRENSYTEILPALSALYRATDQLTLLGGVHRGFSAAGVGSSQDSDPEESTVYEAGGRFDNDKISVEAIGFFSDYSNLIGACTNSTGSSGCDIGDSFNAGEVDVHGLEVQAHTDFQNWNETLPISIPLSLSYTYTDSEFKSDVNSGFFGNVQAGDSLAYVPENQTTITTGLVGDVWRIDMSANYISETRNSAGNGSIPTDELINNRTIVDLTAAWDMKDGVRLHLKAENLFGETYIASRQPYGLRPGKPREIFAGMTLDF